MLELTGELSTLQEGELNHEITIVFLEIADLGTMISEISALRAAGAQPYCSSWPGLRFAGNPLGGPRRSRRLPRHRPRLRV